MELIHYKLVFENGVSYMLGVEIKNENLFIEQLSEKYIKYVVIQNHPNIEPIQIYLNTLFSIQKFKNETITKEMKIWRIINE